MSETKNWFNLGNSFSLYIPNTSQMYYQWVKNWFVTSLSMMMLQNKMKIFSNHISAYMNVMNNGGIAVY
jgi:hypothetical protein